MRRAWRSALAATGALAASGGAAAMSKCPSLPGLPPTSPCASIQQVVVYLVLPAVLTVAIAVCAQRWMRRNWLQFALVSISTLACVAWEMLAIALLGGFLAPCAASCWY
jgi:hypothetical protein